MPRKVEKEGETYIVSDDVDIDEIDTENLTSNESENVYNEFVETLTNKLQESTQNPEQKQNKDKDSTESQQKQTNFRQYPRFEILLSTGNRKKKLTGELISSRVDVLTMSYEFETSKEAGTNFTMDFQKIFSKGKSVRPKRFTFVESIKVITDGKSHKYVPPKGPKGKRSVVLEGFQLKRIYKNKARCVIDLSPYHVAH